MADGYDTEKYGINIMVICPITEFDCTFTEVLLGFETTLSAREKRRSQI